MFCSILLALSITEQTIASDDVEIILDQGTSLIVRDSSGQSVAFQVNESGEVMLPFVAPSNDVEHLCRDRNSGVVAACPPVTRELVGKYNEVIVGAITSSNGRYISDRGYHLWVANETIEAVSLYFESSDCTGQPYIKDDELLTGKVVRSLESMFYVEKRQPSESITTQSITTRFAGDCKVQVNNSAFALRVIPNVPSITGVRNDIGIPSNPFQRPLVIEER